MMVTKTTAKPSTVGEELFLVHLHRQRPEDVVTDRDHDPSAPQASPRKRSRSLGEELWDIHLKRSHGVELDRDEEELAAKTNIKKKVSKQKNVPAHVIHLRNRDVPPPPSMVH